MDEYTGGVPFPVSEEEDSYSENISPSSWTPRVTLRCPYENRYDLVNAVSYREWPHGPNGALVIKPLATNFSIAGDGVPADGTKNNDTEAFDYIDALVTCNYEQVLAGSGPQSNSFDFFTESVEPTIEQLRMPHEQLFWEDPTGQGRIVGLSPDQTPTQPLYRERYRRTYFGVTVPLIDDFSILQNHINTNPVDSPLLGITYDPLTVLYTHRELDYNLRTDGSQSANLSVNFMWRQETWRKHWNWEFMDFVGIQNSEGLIEFPRSADLSVVLMS